MKVLLQYSPSIVDFTGYISLILFALYHVIDFDGSIRLTLKF